MDAFLLMLNIVGGMTLSEGVKDFFDALIDYAKEYAEKYEQDRNEAELEAIDERLKELAEKRLPAPTAEPLAQALCAYTIGIKPDSGVYPKPFIDDCVTAFLEAYGPSGNVPAIRETIYACFREIETALQENLSMGELTMLRHEVLNGAKLDKLLDVVTPSDELNTSNQLYADTFKEPLFLHKGNPNVSLVNLYVKPKFDSLQGNSSQEDIDGYLADFFRNGPQFLFIEGDAGCGKSSLTAYLSYHAAKNDAIAQQILNGMPLVTVRLRNLASIPTDCSEDEQLMNGVLHYLYRDQQSDDEKLERFRAVGPLVLWLDGYDELCAMEGVKDAQALLWTLDNWDHCKIVVTTRPQYLRFGKGEKYWHISLKHFDPDQRREWLYRYEKYCKQTLADVNRQYLERIKDEAAGIFDTPLGLYMIAAGDFEEEALNNEWALYHQIFYEAIQKTEYNRDYKDRKKERLARKYWESLYRVSEEIAWYLYQRGNENLLVPDVEVKEIIKNLNIPDNERKVISRCVSLCGYWRRDTLQGCVEFYHNNIRDFFLCEKIMRELNAAYDEYQARLQDDTADIMLFLQRLCERFQHGKLEKQVFLFLRQRVYYSKKTRKVDLCADMERKHHNTVRIGETLLMTGTPYLACQQEQVNPVVVVGNILHNVFGVYRCLYEPFLQKDERIHWWGDIRKGKARKINQTHMLLLRDVVSFAGPSYFWRAYLRGADLRGADLRGADLTRADLRGADLTRADLRGADLTRAHLSGADLRDAYLSGADLSDADLRGADLRGTDLSGANLDSAHLSGADLNEADLSGADLSGANLNEADFRGADLSGAHLIYAHLSGANLIGADLRDADLSGADLSGAHLTRAHLNEAYLIGADLSGAHLNEADLIGADLRDAHLSGADLRDAHLSGADLRDADLSGADLRGAMIDKEQLKCAFGTPITD